MPHHHEARIKQLCAQAIQLPDSSPELKKVIAELQAVLREQTAGMRALAAEGIMLRPELVSSTESNNNNNADFRESDRASGLTGEPGRLQPDQLQPEQLQSEQEVHKVKSSRNLFSAILRVVLQNPLQKTFPSQQTDPPMD
jgi:hypothetical protein